MKVYLGLICKVGTPRIVLDKLLAHNVPGGNTFLLFGPIDILIEFSAIHSLNNYQEQWLNPISKIGAEEGLIADTLTLIVGQEGPPIHEVPFAIVFVNTKPPQAEMVRRSVLTIPEVLTADFVYGPYDVICPIRAPNIADLERVVLNLQTSASGIERTMTCLIKEIN